MFGFSLFARRQHAETILLEASNYLRLIAMNNGKDLDDLIDGDPTGVYEANVKMVIIHAAERALAAPADMAPDATQWSQSASPYSESMSFTGGNTPSLYFKDKELKLLGLGDVSGKRSMGLLRGVR
jgi:hypothetical protein